MAVPGKWRCQVNRRHTGGWGAVPRSILYVKGVSGDKCLICSPFEENRFPLLWRKEKEADLSDEIERKVDLVTWHRYEATFAASSGW